MFSAMKFRQTASFEMMSFAQNLLVDERRYINTEFLI